MPASRSTPARASTNSISDGGTYRGAAHLDEGAAYFERGVGRTGPSANTHAHTDTHLPPSLGRQSTQGLNSACTERSPPEGREQWEAYPTAAGHLPQVAPPPSAGRTRPVGADLHHASHPPGPGVCQGRGGPHCRNPVPKHGAGWVVPAWPGTKPLGASRR